MKINKLINKFSDDIDHENNRRMAYNRLTNKPKKINKGWKEFFEWFLQHDFKV
jgi:DNA gyrase inhibitor GyrI